MKKNIVNSFYSTAKEFQDAYDYASAIELYKEGYKEGETKCLYGLFSIYKFAPKYKHNLHIFMGLEKYEQLFYDNIEQIQLLANSGDVESMHILYDCYNNGYGVNESDKIAKSWLQKMVLAGDDYAKVEVINRKLKTDEEINDEDILFLEKECAKGNQHALLFLSMMYLYLEPNYEKSKEYANLITNVANKYMCLYRYYAYDDSPEYDQEKAGEYLEEALDSGYPGIELGEKSGYIVDNNICYTEDEFIDVLIEENNNRVSKLEEAANNGDLISKYKLGMLYKYVFYDDMIMDVLPENTDKAIALFEESKDEIYESTLELIDSYHYDVDNPTKFNELVKFIFDKKHIDGLLAIGEIFSNEGVYLKEVESFNKALKCFETVEAEGEAAGTYHKGLLLLRVANSKDEKDKAIYYLNKAANNNNVESLKTLARYFLDNDMTENLLELNNLINNNYCDRHDIYDIRANINEYLMTLGYEIEPPFKLYLKAFENVVEDEKPEVAYKLGYYYMLGLYTQQNLKLAKEYFDFANNHGYPCDFAIETLDKYNNSNPSMRQICYKIQQLDLDDEQACAKIDEEIEAYVGESWGLLGTNEQKFLVTGIRTYYLYKKMGRKFYDGCDFSTVILPLFKALELILCKIFVKGYIGYLKFRGISPSSFLGDRFFISNKDAKFIKESDCDKFTLGAFKSVLGNAFYADYNISKSTSGPIVEIKHLDKFFKENYKNKSEIVDKYMVDYFCDIVNDSERGAYLGSEAEVYLIRFSEELSEIVKEMRNPSAHKNAMEEGEAVTCCDYLIFTRQMLVELLHKIDYNKVQFYLDEMKNIL